MKKKKTIKNILAHTVLTILAIVWVSPLLWIILTSFRAQKGAYTSSFFPKQYSFDNYLKLFTDTGILNFPRMFTNTLIVAVFSCIISTFLELDALQKALEMDKETFLKLKKDEIVPFIEEEIAVRYHFQEAGIKIRLRYDEQLKKALASPMIEL